MDPKHQFLASLLGWTGLSLDVPDFRPETLQTLGSILLLVVSWAFVRPNMIRDDEDRRLPYNTTARLAFAIACAVVYSTLALAFQIFSGMTDMIAAAVPLLRGLLHPFRDQPPLLAALTLVGLLQLNRFHEMERATIIWLHSRRYVHDDVKELGEHLAQKQFEPAVAEVEEYHAIARRHGVDITDQRLEPVGLVMIDSWRKATTLLRLTREWNRSDEARERTLGKDDMRELAQAEESHDRKTELALTIVKMHDEVERGGKASDALDRILKLLAGTQNVDRPLAEEAERQASMIGAEADRPDTRTLSLTGAQLKHHLAGISRYFEREYEQLAERAAILAAKSVVLGGDHGAPRLQALKQSGFQGLGRIQQNSLDRVLWLFMLVAVGGFLLLYMVNADPTKPGQAEVLARFAFSMAIAALIGAIIGSRRGHVKSEHVPWSRYLTGGLISAATFAAIHILSGLVKDGFGIAPPRGQPQFSLHQMIPWCLLPALTSIAIARLARVERWGVPRWMYVRSVIARVIDACMVGITLAVAFIAAVKAHPLLGLDLPPSVATTVEEAPLGLPWSWGLFWLGFLIGIVVVRDVRRAAHATLIAKAVPSPVSEVDSEDEHEAQLPPPAAKPVVVLAGQDDGAGETTAAPPAAHVIAALAQRQGARIVPFDAERART